MKQIADSIFKSSKIYTVTEGMKKGAIAVKKGKILAVVSEDAIDNYACSDTKIYDFKDNLLTPGLIDGHTHMMAYSPKADLSQATSIDQCLKYITDFNIKHSDEPIIMGEKWYAANWGGQLPSRYDIDMVIADKPFFATDLDIHLLWCNSRFMDMLGMLTKNLDEVTNHRTNMVDLDENGIPTGILRDEIAMEVLNKFKAKATIENVTAMFDVWTKFGVTAINDMDFYLPNNEIFRITKVLEREGKLNVRVFASLDAAKATDENIEYAKSIMNSDMFRVNSLKAFMDGTGAGLTAFMKTPYKGTTSCGNQYLSKEQLMKFIKLAARHGIAMHTHCCGDKAVAEVLSVYKDAGDNGVVLDERFSIEHCDTTDETDMPLPAILKISLNLTPDFLAPTYRWKDNPYMKIYDENTKSELWRIKSFIDTGVNVSFGTDYTASSMNPFDQLYRATERVANDGNPEGGYNPKEKIDIYTALYCYTMGSAKSCGMSDKIGSIEVGKYADFAVWDTDFLNCDRKQLKECKALATIVNGNVVFYNGQ